MWLIRVCIRLHGIVISIDELLKRLQINWFETSHGKAYLVNFFEANTLWIRSRLFNSNSQTILSSLQRGPIVDIAAAALAHIRKLTVNLVRWQWPCIALHSVSAHNASICLSIGWISFVRLPAFVHLRQQLRQSSMHPHGPDLMDRCCLLYAHQYVACLRLHMYSWKPSSSYRSLAPFPKPNHQHTHGKRLVKMQLIITLSSSSSARLPLRYSFVYARNRPLVWSVMACPATW